MYRPLATARSVWRDGPVTYFHTTGYMMVSLDCQKVLVKGMRDADASVQCVSVESGHCPNLTRPDVVSEIVKKSVVAKGWAATMMVSNRIRMQARETWKVQSSTVMLQAREQNYYMSVYI